MIPIGLAKTLRRKGLKSRWLARGMWSHRKHHLAKCIVATKLAAVLHRLPSKNNFEASSTQRPKPIHRAVSSRWASNSDSTTDRRSQRNVPKRCLEVRQAINIEGVSSTHRLPNKDQDSAHQQSSSLLLSPYQVHASTARHKQRKVPKMSIEI